MNSGRIVRKLARGHSHAVPPWCRLFCVLFIGIPCPQSIIAQQPNPSRQVIADGPVSLTIQLDKTDAQIADPILLRIQVDAPEGTLITFPVVTDTIGPFSVINTETIRDLPLEGAAARRRWTTTIELESLESGVQKIPVLEVLYRLPGNFADAASAPEGSLKSEPISIQIVSVLEENEELTQFRDIKDTAELPQTEVSRSDRTWFTVGAALLACATIGLVLWSRRGKRPQPARWALAKVDQIESEFQQDAVDVAEAYSRLSSVLREYFEAEMAFPATSLSSQELVSEFTDTTCPDSVRQRLRHFVIESDELKFSGRLRTGHGQDESPFDSARAIIRETSNVSFQRFQLEDS